MASNADLRAATRATAVAFIACGFATASWAARIPAVRHHLELSPSALGFVLFAIAAGSLIALPMSGMIITRFGSRRTVAGMALLLGIGLCIVAGGYAAGVPVLVGGLFVVGFATGGWDVAMNVHAAVVEQRLGRPIMSRFHAGYSIGTVGGALVGAGASAVGLSPTIHLSVVAVLAGVWTAVAVQRFLDVEQAPRNDAAAPERSGTWAWRERRTLLIGVFVLAFAFAEGTANDWVSVAAIDGYGVSAAVGGVTYALFLTAMTTGRWFGPALLTRYGRVPVVRVQALLAVAGVALFVYGGSLAVAVIGALLWGIGVSLGFPVGMSAGADEPQHAAARVSVVSSIGYCAFLAGPPLIGVLGDAFTTLHALTVVAVLLAVSAAVSRNVAPPAADDAQQRADERHVVTA